MNDCPFCKGRDKLRQAMDLLETEFIPEMGVALYDDVIAEAYNALDDALSLWRCYCDGDE